MSQARLTLRSSWLPGLVLALIGFAMWTLFSLWPWLMTAGAPFRIREAWDTPQFWQVGVPVMLLAQIVGAVLSDDRISWQPLGMLGGLLAGIALVRPSGGDFGMLPVAMILIGAPAYAALLAAAAVGRTVRDRLGT
jgi:hypothetical protein